MEGTRHQMDGCWRMDRSLGLWWSNISNWGLLHLKDVLSPFLQILGVELGGAGSWEMWDPLNFYSCVPESQNFWVWKASWKLFGPSFLLKGGSAREGCSGPCLPWSISRHGNCSLSGQPIPVFNVQSSLIKELNWLLEEDRKKPPQYKKNSKWYLK